MGRRAPRRASGGRGGTADAAAPRVLFLHGYTSNGILFERKLAALLRCVRVCPVFATAPHGANASWVEGEAEELGDRGAARSWLVDGHSASGLASETWTEAGRDDGWEASAEVITSLCPDGVDGIVGFSQGCLAALRVLAGPSGAPGSLSRSNDAPRGRTVRFVVLCSSPDLTSDPALASLKSPPSPAPPSPPAASQTSGCQSGCLSARTSTPLERDRRDHLFLGARGLPSLHAFSDADSSVPASESRATFEAFGPRALKFEHRRGHSVPTSGDFAAALQALVDEAMATAGPAPAPRPAPRPAPPAQDARPPAHRSRAPAPPGAGRGAAKEEAEANRTSGAPEPSPGGAAAPAPAAEAAPVPELTEDAAGELEALRAILADDMEEEDSGGAWVATGAADALGPVGERELEAGGGGGRGAGQRRFRVRLNGPVCDGTPMAEGALGARLWLVVTLPPGYPAAASLRRCARLDVEPTDGAAPYFEKPESVARALAAAVDAAADGAIGAPAVFDLVTAAKDLLATCFSGERAHETSSDDGDAERGAAVGRGATERRANGEGGEGARESGEASGDGVGALGAGSVLGLPARRPGCAPGSAGLSSALCAQLARGDGLLGADAAPPSTTGGSRGAVGTTPAGLTAARPRALSGGAAAGEASAGRAGRWRFVIGLVGKPSAGKSSFFNAATASVAAKVGAYPFTTIEPNTGAALVRIRAPAGSGMSNVSVPVVLKDVAGLVPGACDGKGRGNRFLNDLCDADALVHIADASGSADACGNIVVSAAADAPVDGGGGGGGVATACAAGGTSRRCTADTGADASAGAASVAAGASTMQRDVAWVHEELSRWIFDNVTCKWPTVMRRPEYLFQLFTGYHCPPAVAERAACALRQTNSLPPLDDVAAWTADHVAALVDGFLAVRFPTVICANKADLPAAAAHIAELRGELGRKGAALADSVVPASALCECDLLRLVRDGALRPVAAGVGAAAGEAGHAPRNDAGDTRRGAGSAAGAGDGLTCDARAAVRFEVRARAPATPTTTAPRPALSSASRDEAEARDVSAIRRARHCGYTFCAEAAAPARLAEAACGPLAPRQTGGAETVGSSGVPTLHVAAGVRTTLERAFWLRPPVVVFPACDLATARSYPLSETAIREGGDEAADRWAVRDVVLLRPGSTVWDLFNILLHPPYRLVGGEFVRAEGRPRDDPQAVRQLRKDEALAQGFVVRLYSTRKGQRVRH